MQLWSETNWFAVQAKSQRENLAAASLATLGVETFLPRIRQAEMICGMERLVSRPLFPGYFFARYCPTAVFEAIRYARGVLRVLGGRENPLPISESIIHAIREREQEDGFIELKRAVFEPGARVTIEEGPLAGWMGQVEREWNDGKRVMILLDAIQQARLLVAHRWLAVEATN